MKNSIFNFFTSFFYFFSFYKLFGTKVVKFFYLLRLFFLNIYVFGRFSKYIKNKGVNTKFIGIPDFSPDFRGPLKLDLSENIEIYPDVSFRGRGLISIGANSSINSGVIFGCTEKISLGKNVLVADNVSFRNADHEFKNVDIPIKNQGEISKEIIINDDVWIGANVVITKGVTIGKGAVIGANAVVNKDIPSYKIYGGVPAKEIGCRKLKINK